MEKLNEFLKENKSKLQQFYDKIAIDSSPQSGKEEEEVDVPSSAKENAISFIHTFVVENQLALSKELQSVDSVSNCLIAYLLSRP